MRSSSRTLNVLVPSAVALFALSMSSSARAESDAEEVRQFRETAERYGQRMREFHGDVKQLVDLAEQEERERIEQGFGAAISRNQDDGNTLRRVAVAKIESFLQKYPDSKHVPDMKFRLADLYYDESELDFIARNDEYAVLVESGTGNPDLVPKKDYRRSIGLYRDILANSPAFAFRADVLYMLGWCLGSANAEQYDETAARDAYQAIVTQHPRSAFTNDANMRLGEYYFELPAPRPDTLANVRIAVTYYDAVMAEGPQGRNYDRAIYKLGWSHFKLDDFQRSLAYLVQLLDYSDALYDRTGKLADTRKEAVEYLAISYADMADRQGKRPIDVARAHLSKVGDKRWQHDVVERMALILEKQTKWDEAVDTYRFLQSRWPTHPQNPIYQQTVAAIYGAKMPVRNEAAAAVALTELGTNYNDQSAWYAANKNNPDAIAAARIFIERSLATVAIEKLLRAQETQNPADYRDAADTFQSFLQKFPFTPDYDEYEWYQALSLYEGKLFPSAARAYGQILKNPRSKYKDGARFQLMKSREELVLSKYGKLEDVPQGALIANTLQTKAGKQIIQYMVSDEQKAFVVAADDLADREFTDMDWISVLEKSRPALSYLAGVVSFNHGYYDDARKRLWGVVNRYPGSPEAAFASKLVLQSYVNEGDLETVKAVALKFGDLEIAGQAGLELCLQFGKADKHLESAACYGQYIIDFPKSEYLNVALYNQANQLDLGGQTAPANVLFEKYINDYPDDERSKSLYFRIAAGYSSILELDKAIRYFETLVKKAPEHADAASALYNAAFLRTGIGDHVGAARAYERYANLPNVPDAEVIYWKAGEQWELVGPREAVEFYDNYLRTFSADEPSHAIIAQHKLSVLYLARGDKRKAAQKLSDLDVTFRDNVARGVSSDARELAAKPPTQKLLADLESYKVIKWSRDEKSNAELLLVTKREDLKVLVDGALSLIQTYQDYDASVAALYVQGAGYFAYADFVYGFPLPAGLTEAEKGIFQTELDVRFTPIRVASEDTAKTRLQGALEKARQDQRWSEWNGKVMELLHDRYPIEYPSERQESRGAVDFTSIPFEAPESARTGGAQ